jgi:hypothetical protein
MRAGTSTGGGSKTNDSALTNGLLPGWINFVFTTKVEGLDIKAHVGFAPGINDKSTVVGLPSDPSCGADAGCDSPFSQIDTRNLISSARRAPATTCSPAT